MKQFDVHFFPVLLILLIIASSCTVVGDSGTADRFDWQNGESIVPANDELLSSEQRQLYRKDAEKLAVRHINELDSTQTEIPQKLVDLLYKGLVHIALSNDPKAKDVTETYNVHARMPVSPREIIVEADTTAEWISAWRNEITKTGNKELDTLIEQFNFTLVEYRELKHVLPTAMATLRSDQVINGYAVGRLFERLEDIESAGYDYVTDGSDIRVIFFENHLQYIYEYGFGDCPSGCIGNHRWKFNVYKDGDVVFAGEEGDPLP